MNYRDKMTALSVERGWGDNLSMLDPVKYQALAIAVRPITERIVDGAAALTSVALTSRGVRIVPEIQAASNERICRQCPRGMFRELRNGEPACDVCQCADKYIRSKWKDKHGHCPHGYWDNRRGDIDQSKLAAHQPAVMSTY